MSVGEYRKVEFYYAEEIRTDEDNEIESEDTFVSSEDFGILMDQLEDEIQEIIDALEEYDTKEALENLKELKEKLY